MSSKLLGHKKMYDLVSELVGSELRSEFEQSMYEKSGAYEWISVYSGDLKYKLMSGFLGSMLVLTVWDLDGNRLTRRVLNGYGVHKVLI